MTGQRLVGLTAVITLGAGLSLGDGCAHTRATPPPPAAVPPTKPEREQAAETGIPISGSAHGILRDGAERRIQRRLQKKGFLGGERTDGQLDPQTRDALRRFQKQEGLPPTGLPSYETVRHLGLDLDLIFETVTHPRERPASSSR
ncbi:MAG TPA: peptidoglycan-binding domain-containing protein [Polyangia bacterium]|jgi:peptidoglycan hydrolase-like protein with peptidoglycan-binding domain|nr:peptidoglycan-binding domain-containing protein [Polyangia bacterium]